MCIRDRFDAAQAEMSDQDTINMLISRECAMTYLVGGQTYFLKMIEGSADEFGTFPLYGMGEDSSFCATSYGNKIGLNKRLGEPGNEKKLEHALKPVSYTHLDVYKRQLQGYPDQNTDDRQRLRTA